MFLYFNKKISKIKKQNKIVKDFPRNQPFSELYKCGYPG